MACTCGGEQQDGANRSHGNWKCETDNPGEDGRPLGFFEACAWAECAGVHYGYSVEVRSQRDCARSVTVLA